MTDTEPMTDDQLASYLMEMERQAVSFRDGELADEQATAIDFYECRPFGDEEEGRSQIIVPVVQEVVDYMTVSVLRTFVSGDRVVEFEANSPEMADLVEDQTEAVNYTFMRSQDGYRVLHDWLKTALVEKICAVETMCVEEEKRARRTVTVLPDEMAMLIDDGNVIEAEENPDGSFTAKIETVTRKKKYIDLAIPNYEFLFSPRTRHEDESEYLCHRATKTLSDLVEMGFDRDLVEGLPGSDVSNSEDEREEATWEDEYQQDVNESIPGLRKVTLRKEYARIDFDNDGKAELLRVYRVGNTILEAEEVDEQPFVVFCPFPRAHRLVGNGLADKVMDIQRNKSVVLRQSFDAFYQSNDPKLWLDEGSISENTIDDLLTKGPGVIVRGKAGGLPPSPIMIPMDIGKGLSVLDYLTGEQESRTGITRLNQGLDADTQNKTFGGMALQSAQGQQIEEFVARNFAEALSRLFMKKLRLMIEHGDPISMRVDGEFKDANPQDWSDDVGVTIRVGLGSGRKDQRLQNRFQVAALQEKAMAGGLTLVTPKHIWNSAAGIVRDSGLGDPNDFFADPGSESEQQQDQPDPEMQKVQAEMQMEQQKLQTNLQIQREKNAGEIQIKRERMVAEMQIARERAELEAQLGLVTSGLHPGGDLSE